MRYRRDRRRTGGVHALVLHRLHLGGTGGDFLEDLYVTPAARGAGVGKTLLKRLAERCTSEDLGRLEWRVLDWNAPAIGFYDRLGAETLGEWITRRLSGEALRQMAAS